jgi:hypothetical protein
VHPELDKMVANLELMPFKLKMRKKNKMGQRQLDLLQRLRPAQKFTQGAGSTQK